MPWEGIPCRPGAGVEGPPSARARSVPSPERRGPLPGSNTLRETEGDTERSRGASGARVGVWPQILNSGPHVACSPLPSTEGARGATLQTLAEKML